VLRASAVVEREGIPTVSIISTGFLKQAAVVAKGLGLPEMAIAEFPGVPMTQSKAELREQVVTLLLPRIIEGLSKPIERKTSEREALVPEPREIVFRGDFDAVQEHFHAQSWSDGMSVVPPTLERVAKFLKFTERDPTEVIGVMPPAHREATVWNIAVNGVIAGCRPEYMPILLAVVEAVCVPEYKIEDAGSTPGWESLIVLSGPIAKALGFNSGQGVMRMGRQPNTSVGRFLRLLLRNIAGFTHGPEGADKGSIGQSFLVAAAEDEDAVAQIGWQPYSVDRGFNAGDNVVTVQSVVAISAPAYSQSEHATEHAELLADVIGQRACGYWTAIGMCYANWHPLIMLGPSIAKVFAQDGWCKNDIRQYFYEHVKISARDAERYAYGAGLTGFRIANNVNQGLLPPEYAASDDPERMVPVFQKAGWIGIVVAGDAGRNQSKGFVCNHVQGVPTSRKVVLPQNWEALLAEVRAKS
jgi:hypothetical protein